jgi:hypothetical protein
VYGGILDQLELLLWGITKRVTPKGNNYTFATAFFVGHSASPSISFSPIICGEGEGLCTSPSPLQAI